MSFWIPFALGAISGPFIAVGFWALVGLFCKSTVTRTCLACGTYASHDLNIVDLAKKLTHKHLPSHKRKWREWVQNERSKQAEGKQAHLKALSPVNDKYAE